MGGESNANLACGLFNHLCSIFLTDTHFPTFRVCKRIMYVEIQTKQLNVGKSPPKVGPSSLECSILETDYAPFLTYHQPPPKYHTDILGNHESGITMVLRWWDKGAGPTDRMYNSMTSEWTTVLFHLLDRYKPLFLNCGGIY